MPQLLINNFKSIVASLDVPKFLVTDGGKQMYAGQFHKLYMNGIL